MPSPFFAGNRLPSPPKKLSSTLSLNQEQRIHTLLQEAFSRHDRCKNPLLDTIQQTIDTEGQNHMYGNEDGQGTKVVLDERALWGVERRLEVFILKQGGKVPGLEGGETKAAKSEETMARDVGKKKRGDRKKWGAVDFVDGEMVYEEMEDDDVSDDSEAWDATMSTDEESVVTSEGATERVLDEEEMELMFDK